MHQKLTHTDVLGLQEVVTLGGDLLLLPKQDAIPYEEGRALEMAGIIKPESSSIYASTYQAMRMSTQYCDERARAGDTEPSWVMSLPIAMRVRCRLDYALTKLDAFQIVPSFPHTGLSYMVTEDGLCSETARIFNLWRLSGIKQLGFLQAPHDTEHPERLTLNIKTPLSTGTRWQHSLDVMAVATVMGHNLGLPDYLQNTLRVSALSHDVGTPAGGDSVKLVDMDALDEDKNYPSFIDPLDWRPIGQFGVRKDLVTATVQGKGLLGEFLDVADKLSYVARDLDKCGHHLLIGLESDQLGLRSLARLVQDHPYMCSIWDTVTIQDNHVCFTDVRRLVTFLKVRVLMFRELYYHRVSRFGEYLTSRLLVKTMYEQGKVTRDELVSMTDDALDMRIRDEFGIPDALHLFASDLGRCRSFKGLEEAEAFRRELQKDGNVFTILDDDRRMIKPGLNLHVFTSSGAKPLKDADPGSAQELTEMATLLPMVKVYYLAGDPGIPSEKLRAWKEHLRTFPA